MIPRVYNAVVNTLTAIQTASGRATPITGSTCPMGGLDGFDSLNAVEASFGFSDALGCEITEDLSLFYNSTTGEPATVDEIVDKLCTIVEKAESA